MGLKKLDEAINDRTRWGREQHGSRWDSWSEEKFREEVAEEILDGINYCRKWMEKHGTRTTPVLEHLYEAHKKLWEIAP